MLPLLLIVLKVILVQSINSKELNHNNNDNSWSDVRVPLNNAFHESKETSVKNFVSNKDDVYNTALFIDRFYKNRNDRDTVVATLGNLDPTLMELQQVLSKYLVKNNVRREFNPHKRVKKSHDVGKWDRWNEWSPCSVTCGKGREIRWRNCLENCDGIQLEMQEKECQLPECERKLFGFLHL